MHRHMTALCVCLAAFVGQRVAADFEAPVAITNVTVHDASGPAIRDATIVMADGRITDVGKDVAVPVGAEVIDGTGLHAYPGFIDAHCRYGLPDNPRTEADRQRLEDENPDVAQGPLVKTRRANRRGIHPQVRTRDICAPAKEEREAYHRRGFTSVLTAPRGGIFGGSSSLINVTTAPVRRAIVARDVAQHASFDPAEPGKYPATALGIIAVFRQFVYDAQWYEQYAKYLARHPRSGGRLPGDPALETMVAFRRSGKPLVFEANSEVQIIRALDLAEEFDLRLWISGGREAYKVADRLKANHVPVIVSLKFDEEPPQTGPVYEPERVRAEKRSLWEEQVSNLQALSKAGIIVAVSSRGLGSPAELLDNLRMALDHGLPVSTAVAALTVNPARLLGLGDVLGSISPGQMANVTLWTHPLESDGTRATQVFVEGKRFTCEDKEEDEAEDDAKVESESTTPPAQRPAEPAWAGEIEADRKPRLQTGGNVLISGGTVMTVSGDTITGGSILIREGRIAAVGTDLAAAEGVAVIDASGLYVMPGIIDCHSHLAIDAANEWPLSISAEVRVGDVLNHRQVAIYRALAGGVTTIHTLHGSTNTIGGQNAILKLRYGRTPQEMRFAGAPRTMKWALGENVTQKGSGSVAARRFPNTRMGVESVLRQALIAAGEYTAQWRSYEDRLTTGEDVPPPRRDLRLETLADVLAGEVHVHCHSYRADECLRLMKVAEDFGFRVAALQHVLEGYRIAPEIARHGCGASTFANMWAYKIEAYSAIPYNAAFLARRGVNVSLNSDSPNLIRYLNVEAGKTIRWGGLSEREALKLITLNPARQLGIAEHVGSIEVGKDGDLALFNGPPLDSFSKCVMTLIDGEVYFEHHAPQRAAPRGKVNSASQESMPVDIGEHALYALVNATLHPISGVEVRNGTVVMRNDRIDAVGRNVTIPPGAVVIDAKGAHVYPGLIDAGSKLGLSEIALAAQTRDDKDAARIQPELRAASAINPFSEHIRVARAVGITTAVAQPTGGWISGRSTLIHLNGWTAEEMTLGEDFAMHMSVPSLPFDVPAKKRQEKEAEHAQQMKELEEFLGLARQYARALESGMAGATAPATRDCLPRDLRLEAMVPFIRGQKPVVFRANSYKSILETVEFADQHGLRCIILGGRESWKCADLLASRDIPVIISTVTSLLAGNYEPFDAVFACASVLDRAGVKCCFASDSAAGAYNLPIEVGMAVAHGLAPERALHALTLGAAEILGVDDELGSIEAGKVANVIVASDWPIQVTAGVTHVFIKGRPVDLRNIHTRNLERFRARPQPVLDPPRSLVGPPSLTERS